MRQALLLVVAPSAGSTTRAPISGGGNREGVSVRRGRRCEISEQTPLVLLVPLCVLLMYTAAAHRALHPTTRTKRMEM